MDFDRVVVVLFGAKAVGKSWVAQELERRADVHVVDADQVVSQLVGSGSRPDPDLGWLPDVEQSVREALVNHPRICVEATGAWSSDWLLADRLAQTGAKVLRVWVFAPLTTSLDRLRRRTTVKVPVTTDEAVWIHDEGTRRAASESFDAVIDTSGAPDPAVVTDLIRLIDDAGADSPAQQPPTAPQR